MPRILAFLSHYLPGHKAGGPVRTIANMVEALGDEVDFRIVTTDRDLLDKKPYAGIIANSWIRTGKAEVYYVTAAWMDIHNCLNLIKSERPDFIYLNSLFSPRFSILPIICANILSIEKKKIILAPRGELSPAALALKAAKKSFFIALVKKTGIYRGIRWQASSIEERKMVVDHFDRGCNVVVARDIPDCSVLRKDLSDISPATTTLRLVFLSRISPMKNLDFALRVLARCDIPLLFDIWGTVEDTAYWSLCQSFLGRLPNNVVATYRGTAQHSDVIEILGRYDLFFLPSHGENYGHAIAEAVSAGTPVLISDRTPWRNLESSDAGWDLPLENGEDGFVAAIRATDARIKGERQQWRRRVREFATRFLLDPAVLEASRALFRRPN